MPFSPFLVYLEQVAALLKHFSNSALGPSSLFHMPQGLHIKTWEMAHQYIFAIDHQSTAIIYSLRCGPEIQLSHISRENTSGVAAPPIFSSAWLPTAFLGYTTWHPLVRGAFILLCPHNLFWVKSWGLSRGLARVHVTAVDWGSQLLSHVSACTPTSDKLFEVSLLDPPILTIRSFQQ